MSDIAMLFARDPLKLTREDIDTIIAELRRQRKNFPIDAKPVRAAKKPTARRQTKREALVAGLEVEVKL